MISVRLHCLQLTVVGLEELDEAEVEPQAVLLAQVLGDRVILVDELEDVRADIAEARIFSQAEDAGDELIGAHARVKDGVQGFSVADAGQPRKEKRGKRAHRLIGPGSRLYS